jgi:hypothetical protein
MALQLAKPVYLAFTPGHLGSNDAVVNCARGGDA